ncbi:MAG: hypothetical protein ACT4QD_23895 [Acidobacteriota bacterium]
MTKIGDLHRHWSKEAAYHDASDDLGEEIDVARAADRSAHSCGGCRSRSSLDV